jgi:hypothetical protein
MPPKTFPYQPGAILHDAIMAGLRARNRTLVDFCAERGIDTQAARQASFGQSGGPKGRALVAAMIEAAGPAFVHQVYISRLAEHHAAMARATATGGPNDTLSPPPQRKAS